MGISIKTVDLEPSFPRGAMPPLPAMGAGELSPELKFEIGRFLVSNIDSVLDNKLQNAMATSIDRAQRIADDMLIRTKEALAGFEKPKAHVMAVEVEGEIRKLPGIASPALGRMIVNAKLSQADAKNPLNTLLVGPAGCGKTTAAKQLAVALALPFYSLSMTQGASEAWLLGRHTANGFIPSEFTQAYRNGGVFLMDEMDACDANVLMLLQQAIDGDTFAHPTSGETITKHKDFVFVAGANTTGLGGDAVYTARSRLDGATLNRFIPIVVDYSDEIEKAVCPDKTLYRKLVNARKKIRKLGGDQIISTRTLAKAYTQVNAGISLAEVLASVCVGWPSELIEQCNLHNTEAPSEAEAVEDGKAPF